MAHDPVRNPDLPTVLTAVTYLHSEQKALLMIEPDLTEAALFYKVNTYQRFILSPRVYNKYYLITILFMEPIGINSFKRNYILKHE